MVHRSNVTVVPLPIINKTYSPAAGQSAAEREIGSGHKWPVGVGWAESSQKGDRGWAEVAWWCQLS